MSKPFSLDLSKFKKVSSDHRGTTMRHEDGHELTIAHSSLSPKLKKQLDGLPGYADGGMTEENSSSPPNEADAIIQDAQSQPAPNPFESQISDRANFYMQGEPGLYQGNPDLARRRAESDILASAEKDKTAQSWKDKSAADDAAFKSKQDQDYNSRAQALGLPMRPSMPDGIQVASNNPMTMDMASSGEMQSPQAAPAPGASQMSSFMAPYDQQIAAQNKLGQIESVGQANQAKAVQGAIDSQPKPEIMQQRIQEYHQAAQTAMTESDNIAHDYASEHIDPNRVWANMGVPAKIGTAIGMILGGIGAGLTGGENPALKIMQNNIDRDIDSQKSNLGAKHNLMSYNMQKYGNMRAAEDATRMQMLSIADLQLKKAALQSGSQEAIQRATIASSQIGLQKQQMAIGLANMQLERQLMSGGATEDPSHVAATIDMISLRDPAKAKELRERYVPGAGLAQIPVPQEVRDKVTAATTFDRMAKDLYQWSKENSGSLDPRVTQAGQAKAKELQSFYREKIHGGVYKEGEQEFINGIIDSDPSKFLTQLRVLPKLKAVIDSNQKQMGILYQSVGLKPQSAISHLSPKEQVYAAWAQKNPKNKQAQMVLQKLGIQ